MALFSRGKRTPDEQPESAAPSETDAAGTDAAPGAGAPDAGAVPHVGISVSTYGRPASAAAQPPRPVPQEPGAVPSPGAPEAQVPDNVLLRDALAELPADATGRDVMAVARQLLQGHLFLRVKGDARALLAAGENLPLAMMTSGDKQFAVAYSGLGALRASVIADGDTGTSAMAQPVASVFRYVLAGRYSGLVIDPASGQSRAVIPRELLERIVEEAGGTEFPIKRLVSGQRTPETATEIGRALVDAKLWVSVGQTEQGPGISEARTTDGKRLLEIFSHPLEVIALDRGTQPVPMTPAQLAAVLMTETGLDGVLIDPAGPWMSLTRDDLAPVLALAPES
ncbi:SseB family protein [Microbacterium sp.]|uniref:SseB family protein n=1 Tax=Microbacterium sp. TaxID=51671 RepID=UPI002CF33294|nr:SseB family protein [Microbacterium sp.]HWL76653.1 SseB family protein [Microbacterium sp.]